MTSLHNASGPDPTPPAGIKEYLAIMRLDHSTKHILIVPGIVLAYLLRGIPHDHPIQSFVLGFAAAVCIASANYVINEFLDRDFDKHHPTKSSRSAVQSVMSGHIVVGEWLVLIAIGLLCAAHSSTLMLMISSTFVAQGIVYNVPPLRTKDKAYLDVISESVNNAIRLLIGWAIIDPTSLPPGSIILAYWLGGAFLMSAKRMSEYQEIVASHGAELLVRYRASFAQYTKVSLTASCLVYSLSSIAFLSVFLVECRIEYIIALPIVVMLFTAYFLLSTRPGSTAQKPEKLFREPGLMLILLALVVAFIFASFVNIPLIATLVEQHYISLK
ncbi:UbiA family prenyltransferase [Bradyrhizobium sp. WSM3983]|uniref:UbiA family prenyltransferase n=1 Tax=Bradyrhizobium sp. WSM3983 TaxID=1038867 RepID=UPI000409A873|nr:UbiA family prenyltransferase [Bradyrhizobium sp. WSM3983]